MIRLLVARYFIPHYARTVAYMLQSTEYHAGAFLRWYWRTRDFSRVMYRRELELTRPARLLKLFLTAGMAVELLAGLMLLALGLAQLSTLLWVWGILLIVLNPILWAHIVVVPLWFGRKFIIEPKERKLIAQAEQIFAKHPAVKIAVAGSYGKTSMKELLATVLAEGKKVAATPGNKNVAISHAAFARRLAGDEEVLVIEYGEGEPGDVARFARLTHPTHAVITGLAPAHLDRYKTLQAAGEDIFAVAEYLHENNCYANAESPSLKPFLERFNGVVPYSSAGALGWQVGGVQLSVEGTSFTLQKDTQTLELHSELLGRHQIGPLSFVAALALELGLSEQQVQAGIAATKPYEHRMQPRKLSGAWIIDDTYNGNIEGIRAGLALLAELPARRKIYVTPGLVDQGVETEAVHREMGKLIAAVRPDVVVLMQNSATEIIRASLEAEGYAGKLRIETDPLGFYTGLEHFVAAGDLVLMQNDWTDNYA